VARVGAREEWLSLQEASERLHVHADTLRQWADRGRIRSFRTPGGHRRFQAADVEALAAHSSPELGLLLYASVGKARMAASAGRLASEPWYSNFDEAAKEKQRELGHDLMRLLVEHAGHPDNKDAAAINGLGERYAAMAHSVGLSLADAMRAFHLFETVVSSSVDELALAQAGADAELEREVSWFLNEVLIAMVEAYRRVKA
jgi:excisionase family DNA binding protein